MIKKIKSIKNLAFFYQKPSSQVIATAKEWIGSEFVIDLDKLIANNI